MTPEDRMKDLRSDAPPSESQWLEFRERGHRSVRNRRIAASLGGLATVVAFAFGAYALTTAPRTAPPRPAGSPDSTASPSDKPTLGTTGDQPVQVWLVQGQELSVTFQFTDEPTPEDALERLLAGPTGPDAEAGDATRIPDDTAIKDLTIENGTAFVTLLGDMPDDSDARFAYAQVVFTLTQFEGVKRASVTWESKTRSVPGTPEPRDFSYELLPPLTVETPYPGETLEGTEFVLSGIANVFEANVSWRIVDKDGSVIQEGFITATCGSGCWGTFEDRIEYKGVDNADAVLEVYESSAEDGSQLWLQQIPLNIRTGP